MPTLSEIQTCINNLTTSSDPAEFAILATQANRETSNNLNFSVATVADLPDLVTNNIANGQIVFVVSLGAPVVARVYLYEWLSMDGQLVRKDGLAYVVYTWGFNTSGQLGDATAVNRSSPVLTSSRGTTWCQISAGYHTAAVKTDGTAWTWGCNICGQLGNQSIAPRSSPGTVSGGGNTWCQISAGNNHTAAIKTDGAAWTWGANNCGQLGDNTAVDRSSPVALTGVNTCWHQISAGGAHTAAIKFDGISTWTAWTWGWNLCGQLGNSTAGSSTNRSSPVQPAGGGTTWCQIHAGNQHTAAIKTDCTAWTWGRNSSGQLGDGTTVSRSSPVQTTGVNSDWCKISAGYHTAAIKTDSTIWTWGLNNAGQLGDGTVLAKNSPVATSGGGTDWCAIDAGICHTAAVKTDGTIWTWGHNTVGQLGNGNLVCRSSPGTICGNLTWCSVSAGQSFTLGIQPS